MAFVYVVDERKPTMKPVKLRMPTNIEQFKKKTRDTLKLPSDVISFKTKTGQVINDADDIYPGDILTVSMTKETKTPKIVELDSSELVHKPLSVMSESYDESLEEDEEEEIIKPILKKLTKFDYFNEEEEIQKNYEKEKTGKTKPEDDLDSYEEEEEAAPELVTATIQVDEEEEKEEESFEKLIETSKQVTEPQDTPLSKLCEADEKRDELERTKKLKQEKTKKKQKKEIKNDIPCQKIISMESIDAKSKELIETCNKETLKYQQKFFQETMKILPGNALVQKRSRLTLLDEIEEKISEYIHNHRIMNSSTICYSFNTVVCGPEKSGKSLFLALLTEQIIAEMITSRVQRTNFFLVLDGAKLSLYSSSLKLFLPKYIEMILSAISLQRPGVKKHEKILVNYMSTVAFSQEESIPPPPMQFVNDENFRLSSESLFQLAARIHDCVLYQEEYGEWDLTIMMLPVLLSEVFGFKKVHFIIDNFEYLNLSISCNNASIDMLECLKEVMALQSFVITGQNIDELFALVANTGGSDLLLNSDFFTTTGIEGSFLGDNREFVVSFEDEARNYRVTPKSCCGCPAYIALWEEACFALEENEGQKEGVIDKLHVLLPLIFKDNPIMAKQIKDANPVSVVV